ncbi:MAG TPA: OmpA family protein [Casimicrobiaceae bacterium]|nr:OmpA family protein [Casimicrobiaceae bacterium]
MNASRAALRIALFAPAAWLAGCAVEERVILLPEANGGPTSLAVRQGTHDVVLDHGYAAADLTLADPWRYEASAEEVHRTFGDALAAQPMRAAHFTLYFSEASDDLTQDSRQALEQMFADLDRRPVRDVVIIGHTDAVGSDQYNDALAKKRADAVKAMLVARGIAQDDIVAIGRGKRDLLVPTPNGVAEPRNRRVEIVVR